MLHNLKQIRGHKLAASDGAIGHVKDFYFDDKTWAIRYLVADTGNWLSGRQVLLSPHSFGHLDQDGKVFSINLTRKQIENSPSIDAHRPVSRQFEKNYYDYYGWPMYWEGGAVWGMGEYPTFAPSTRPYVFEDYQYPRWDDIHLRSTNAVTGYGIHATDGMLGSVSGFLVDQKKWVIRELAIETGHWYSGKEILITPRKVERISYEESKVFVSLSKADLERTEEKHLATAGA
jgi:PRC-barrel domain protein